MSEGGLTEVASDTQPSPGADAVVREAGVAGAPPAATSGSAPAPDAPAGGENEALAALREHGPITGLLFVAVFLRSWRLGATKGSHIGDETWYVQASRVIAGFPVLMHHLRAGVKSGIDPNREHPSLAKVVMAESMRLMGNRELAVRLPSVVLGTLAIWLVYRIVLVLRGTRQQALFAAFVLTFDNLFLIHARIATLDVYFVTFGLVGALLYLEDYLDLAGVAFAVATLCKTNAVLALFSMLLYDAALSWRSWRTPDWRQIARRGRCIALFVAFFLLGLGALDCFFTEFRGPFEHLAWMRHFHAGLTHKGPREGTASSPFDWWLNEGNYNYFTVKSKAKTILYRAMMNGYVIFCGAVALVYAGRKAWRESSPLGAFAVTQVIGQFGPIFLAWAIFSRKSYFYYMLPVVPAIACALALAAAAVPRSTRWGFVVLVLYAFYFSYPIRYL